MENNETKKVLLTEQSEAGVSGGISIIGGADGPTAIFTSKEPAFYGVEGRDVATASEAKKSDAFCGADGPTAIFLAADPGCASAEALLR